MANIVIDWLSRHNEILANPRLPETEKNWLLSAKNFSAQFSNSVFIATSGSGGYIKWVVLSKESLLISAEAVNHHLSSQASDIWLNTLPLFHVGGLGVHARGFLSGAQVAEYEMEKWDPHLFVQQLRRVRATLTSLVPTQLFDLVTSKLTPPLSLRAVIVGGGALSPGLYKKAVSLGWKLLPSYGLTECASQVATAEIGSWEKGDFPDLKPLDHVTLSLDDAAYLKIRSQALLSAYISFDGGQWKLIDPKINGWFLTEDQPQFKNQMIAAIRRRGHFLKIGGESVDLQRLERILEEIRLALGIADDMALVPIPDQRLGYAIHLTTTLQGVELLLQNYQRQVLPFERIRKVHVVPYIPRSPLKKVLYAQLISMVSGNF